MKNKVQTEQIITDLDQIVQKLHLKKQEGANPIIWQKNSDGKRIILNTINLQNVDKENNCLEISSSINRAFESILKESCIYFHYYGDHSIFKSIILEQENDILRVQIPSSIMTYREFTDSDSNSISDSNNNSNSDDIQEDVVIITNKDANDSKTSSESIVVTDSINDNNLADQLTVVSGSEEKLSEDVVVIKGNAEDSRDNVAYEVSSSVDYDALKVEENKAVFRVSEGVKSGAKHPPSSEILKLSSANLSKEEKEELYYKEKRTSDRKQIKGDKHVKLLRKNDENPEAEWYQLLDISQGGMGFVCEDRNEFKPGTVVVIEEISGNSSITNPIEGEVRSVRVREEENNFKVGVRFLNKEPS